MITNDEILKALICSFSAEDDVHYVMEPLTFSNCSHFVCKECLKTPLSENLVLNCKICFKSRNKISRINLDQTNIANDLIEENLQLLLHEVEINAQEQLQDIESINFFIF
jgi:hypothetical protein